MNGGVEARLRARFGPQSPNPLLLLETQSGLELRGPFSGQDDPLFFLRNVTCGVLGGDSLAFELTMEPGANVQVASSSATKVMAMPDASARIETRLEASPGSRLVWGPHTTILQEDAALSQETTIVLHTGGVVIAAEVQALGRLASGERGRFRRFECALSVETSAGESLYQERYVMQPDTLLDASMAGRGVLASVYLLGVDVRAACSRLEEASRGWGLLAGFGALPNGAGVVVRMLANSASEALAFVTSVLRSERPELPAEISGLTAEPIALV